MSKEVVLVVSCALKLFIVKKWPFPFTREPRVSHGLFWLDFFVVPLFLLPRAHLNSRELLAFINEESLLELSTDLRQRRIGGRAGKQPHMMPTLISTTLAL